MRLVPVLFAALLLTACGGSDPIDDILALEGDVSNGETLFSSNCTSCHPADGTEGTGPALNAVVPTLDDASMATSIANGVGIMPVFSNALTNQEIADVMAYVRVTYDE